MKTSCEFRFGFWDQSARPDANLTATQCQSFASLDDMNREKDIDFPDVATLEPGFGWPLDGSKELLPDEPQTTAWGWWSTDLTDEDRNFSAVPTLTVVFYDESGVPSLHSSAGITLSFKYTLPLLMNIKWYDWQGGLLADRDFSPDSFEYFCDCPVTEYSKVVISVKSMSYPYRFLRVTHILFGALEVLGDSRISKASFTEEISPVSLSLPISKAEVSFYTPNGRFALLDPTGAYAFFQWKQELTCYKTIEGVKTMMGKYYLQTAHGTVDAVTSLECVDIIGILDTLEYNGGIYADKPVNELLDEILGPEGVEFELAPEFSGEQLNGYLPIGSIRSALQQIAFAIGAVVDTAGSEVLRIYPAPDIVVRNIGPERKIMGHKITLEELVTQVDVTAHRYIQDKELKELITATLDAGEHTITFGGPVLAAGVTGASMAVNHPNYCVVKVAEAGEVVISGYEYVDLETVHTVRTYPLPAGAKSSVKSISTATLVDPVRAKAAAQRLYDYYQLRYLDEGRLLPGYERAAEKACLTSMNGKPLTGFIQRVVTDLTGGCLETVSVKGAVEV